MKREPDRDAWDRSKRQIRAKYPKLREEDLDYSIEKEEEMLVHLQQKLGKTKDEIRKWLHIIG